MRDPNILFILPDLKTGGTLSSFISMYNALKNTKAIIKIFSLDVHGAENVPFEQGLIKGLHIVNAYKSNFSDMGLFEKILSIPIKLLKKLELLHWIDFQKIVFSHAARTLSKYEFDYVVAFQEDTPTFLASFFKNTVKIAWIHGDYITRYKALQPKNEHRLYSCFDTIVNVSSYTSNSFYSLFPDLKPRCITIHNIIDEEYIKAKSTEYIPNDIAMSSFTIISIGRITRIKRFDKIPEIANYLKSRNLRFEWIILGPNAEKDARKKLENGISRYNVSDCVKIMGNKLNPYPYILKSNLLVCLSSTEACPMIFNEAKICGTPIITSDFGSAYEFVEEGVNGIICPVEEIGLNIESVMVNKDKYQTMVNNMKGYGDINESSALKLYELFNISR